MNLNAHFAKNNSTLIFANLKCFHYVVIVFANNVYYNYFNRAMKMEISLNVQKISNIYNLLLICFK